MRRSVNLEYLSVKEVAEKIGFSYSNKHEVMQGERPSFNFKLMGFDVNAILRGRWSSNRDNYFFVRLTCDINGQKFMRDTSKVSSASFNKFDSKFLEALSKLRTDISSIRDRNIEYIKQNFERIKNIQTGNTLYERIKKSSEYDENDISIRNEDSIARNLCGINELRKKSVEEYINSQGFIPTVPNVNNTTEVSLEFKNTTDTYYNKLSIRENSINIELSGVKVDSNDLSKLDKILKLFKEIQSL